MPQNGGTVSLERDTPELARNYEQAGIVQFHHGKFLIGPLALKAGEHVLDIGTGTGRLAEFVAGLVGSQGRVIGIDPLESRIDIARLRQSKTLTFETGHAEDLSRFGDGQFDAVYLNSVFHWIAEKDRALREIHRVLKPGGRIGTECSGSHQTARVPGSAARSHRAGRPCGPASSIQSRSRCDGRTTQGTVRSGRLHRLPQRPAIAGRYPRRRRLPAEMVGSERLRQFPGADSRNSKAIRCALPSPRLVEAKRTPEGLRLERYLRFAFARKAPLPPPLRTGLDP